MWFTFFMWVCSSIVSALLAPKPPDAKASSTGDFDVPTAEEGRPIGLIFGTCKVSGPNVTWWGDLKVKAIKASTGGFLGIGSKSYTVGWKYYLGMQMALSCEIDELVDIIIGEKSLGISASYAEGGTTLHIDKPDLFGGAQKEGGISGDVDFYFGSDTQLGNSYLAGVVGSAVPGYRGVCHAILRRCYIGTQPYLKTWEWVVRRTRVPDGFSGQGNINGDANPAFIIATLLTRPREKGGRGVPIARIDVASFNAGAATHAAEGFGLSINMDKAQSADNWIQEVCRHVDAAVYTDQETGLITYKPIRADYDPTTIPAFGPDDLKEAPEINRPSWSETLNRVVIRYNSRANGFTVATAQDRDPANRAIRGEEALGVFDFFGASNATIAQKIATRERRTHAYPLASLNLTLNRRAWKLRPGSPFRLVFPAMDVSMICRVANIKYGTFESGAITVEAAEDIFATPPATYDPPPVSGWTEAISAPVVASQQVLVEAPYWLVAENRHVLVMAARGDATTQSMDLYVNTGSGYIQADPLESPTPTGVLTAAWSCKTAALDSTGFVVGSGTDLDHLPEYSTDAAGRARGTNLALVGGTEWVSWTTATDNGDGTVTIGGVLRGILDTPPVDHAAGERVWFASQGAAVLPTTDSGGAGPQGDTGPIGPQGLVGATGPQGPAGVGVPAGGYPGQLLAKRSNADYDSEWVDAGSGPGGEGVWRFFDAKKPFASPSSLDDEFEISTLDGRWTPILFGGASINLNDIKASGLTVCLPAGTGDKCNGVVQPIPIPSGDWTIWTVSELAAVGTACAGLITSTANNKSGSQTQWNILQEGGWNWNIAHTAGGFSGFGGFIISNTSNLNGGHAFQRLRKQGSNYYYAISIDGETWLESTPVALSYVPTYFGIFGKNINGNYAGKASFDFFRYMPEGSGNTKLGDYRVVVCN